VNTASCSKRRQDPDDDMAWFDPTTGHRLSHPEALGHLSRSRVVLIGEQHDRAADHRFQELTIAGLASHVRDLSAGFEMFPCQAQPVLDAWGQGGMSEAEFLREVAWEQVWGFPAELYLPLFRLCRDLALPMFAMNVARPVVSLVGRDGWNALPPEYRTWLSPAEPASPEHRRYLFEITGGIRPDREAQSPEDPAFDRFVRAQQVWDRAFACAIARVCAAGPEVHAVGIIGRGHLEYRLGVPEQLAALGLDDVVVALPHHGGANTARIADLCFVLSGKLHTPATD
jgi:uncharacterized iron-regulated protein